MAKSTTLPPGQLSLESGVTLEPAWFYALLDASLHQPTEARVQRLRTVYRAAHLLATLTEWSTLTNEVFPGLLDALAIAQSLLYLHDETDHTLHLLAEHGVSPELCATVGRLPVDAQDPRIAARVAAIGRAQVTHGFLTGAARPIAQAPILVTLPLFAHGSLIAVWQIIPRSWQQLDKEDLAAFITIGDEIASALRRIRLIAASRHHADPPGHHCAEERTIDPRTEFISTVSHELRTPLTSIAGYTEMLLDGAAGMLNDEQQSSLNIVKHNVDRLTGMIEDLLDISRIESGRIKIAHELVDMNAVIRHVAASLQPQIQRKFQQLTLDLDPALPAVWGDNDRLTRAVANLVMNAHKYTPEYGHLTITSRVAEQTVLIAVTDTGIGLTAEEQEHLFEKFYRAGQSTSHIRQGAGLGLSITRSIAQIHGGDVVVTSKAGQGSTFTLRLPLGANAARDTHEAALEIGRYLQQP